MINMTQQDLHRDSERAGATDVGPILRRFLTRTDSFFGHVDGLTLCDKLIRGQVPK